MNGNLALEFVFLSDSLKRSSTVLEDLHLRNVEKLTCYFISNLNFCVMQTVIFNSHFIIQSSIISS